MEPEQKVLFPIVGGGVAELADVACFCLPVTIRSRVVATSVPKDKVGQIDRILRDACAGETDQGCTPKPIRVRLNPANFCGGSFSLALALADKRARLGPGVLKPARIIATGVIRAGGGGVVDPVECFEVKLGEIAKIANSEDTVVVPSANIAAGTTVEHHWQEMRARGVRCFAINNLDQVSFLWGSVNPYIGLRTFTKNESQIFFGREREINDLVKELRDNPDRRFLAVVGASGTGKSSLVYAGLLPRLERGEIEGSEGWRVASFTPGSYSADPSVALAAVLNPLLPQSNVEKPFELAAVLANDPERILQYVDQVLAEAPTSAQLVLVVDQMEELFTQAAEAHRERFVKLLAKAAEHPRVRILATLRVDFLAEAQRYPPLDIWLQRPFMLAPPGPMALAEMIHSPARLAGIKIEEGLADKVLQDAGNNIGAMPLVAFTLNKLYRPDEKEPPHIFITVDDYDSIGGIHGAITKHAETLLEKWPQIKINETYDKEKIINTIFGHLVGFDANGNEFRRRAKTDEFQLNDSVINLLNYLVNKSRLIVCTSPENCSIVELVHDALLHKWRRLEEWIELNREEKALWADLEKDADKCSKTHDKNLLWRGRRLRKARKLLEHPPPYIKSNETEILKITQFIKKSIAKVWLKISYASISGSMILTLFVVIVWFFITPKTTMPVGSFDPNPFGLYDVLGNVWEWTQECMTAESSLENRLAQVGQKYEWCLVRGGSWDNYQPDRVSVVSRVPIEKDQRGRSVGFRVVRELEPEERTSSTMDYLEVQECFEGKDQENFNKKIECFRECEHCPKMVIVSKEKLESETPLSEGGSSRRESLLAVGQYEVTVAEWNACVKDGGCKGKNHDDKEHHPVTGVNWDDAQDYAKWLSSKITSHLDNQTDNQINHQPYRLPSGAEWEYAARGGEEYCRPWGPELGSGNANCEVCGVMVERFIDWIGAPVGSIRNKFVEPIRNHVNTVFDSILDRFMKSNRPVQNTCLE